MAVFVDKLVIAVGICNDCTNLACTGLRNNIADHWRGKVGEIEKLVCKLYKLREGISLNEEHHILTQTSGPHNKRKQQTPYSGAYSNRTRAVRLMCTAKCQLFDARHVHIAIQQGPIGGPR